MRISLLLIGCACALLGSCASDEGPEPLPLSSEHSDMPWNTPQPGEGQGALGGIFENR